MKKDQAKQFYQLRQKLWLSKKITYKKRDESMIHPFFYNNLLHHRLLYCDFESLSHNISFTNVALGICIMRPYLRYL